MLRTEGLKGPRRRPTRGESPAAAGVGKSPARARVVCERVRATKSRIVGAAATGIGDPGRCSDIAARATSRRAFVAGAPTIVVAIHERAAYATRECSLTRASFAQGASSTRVSACTAIAWVILKICTASSNRRSGRFELYADWRTGRTGWATAVTHRLTGHEVYCDGLLTRRRNRDRVVTGRVRSNRSAVPRAASPSDSWGALERQQGRGRRQIRDGSARVRTRGNCELQAETGAARARATNGAN